jgi:hypothetical protein
VAKFTDTLKNLLLPKSRKEELVAEHIIREHHKDRSLDDILKDTYVTNLLPPERLDRVLERPDVLEAVGDDLAAMRSAAPPR